MLEKNEAMYNTYSSQDRKILTWDKNDIEQFFDSFTEEELSEMTSYLAHHPYFPLECDYDEENRAGSIVCDYVRRWLYEQLEDGIQTGTKELFDIVLAIS